MKRDSTNQWQVGTAETKAAKFSRLASARVKARSKSNQPRRRPGISAVPKDASASGQDRELPKRGSASGRGAFKGRG
jgi:hypothetical protein